MKAILGISAFYHDSAAALIIDGEIIAAAQEERFTRKKHDPAYPINAINYCLKEAGLELNQVDYIAFYDKPFLKFERLLETYVAFAPKGIQSFRMAMPIWLREKLFLKNMLIKEIKKSDEKFDINKLMFGEHHFSHAASAFYASPFEEAIVLTLDGVGEWATTTVAIGKGSKLDIVKEIHFPHSLGLLYSAFTYYIGFRVNSGEYKVMGLAPYGEPRFKNLIFDKLIDLKNDGSFRLNQKYFNYTTEFEMISQSFVDLFGEPIRKNDDQNLTQFHMDIAASIQSVTEEVVLRIARWTADKYKLENLCLAGGVALNCVANGKILKEKIFKNVWVQPAAGDAGGAIGACLAVWHLFLEKPKIEFDDKQDDFMSGSYLGPKFDDSEIEKSLKSPSLYDDVIALLDRRGFKIDQKMLERDWTQPYEVNMSVEAAWLKIYKEASLENDLYNLGEKLTSLDENFSIYRWRHFLTVQKIIGYKPGTGGSAGVGWLENVTSHRFFPELWSIRTNL